MSDLIDRANDRAQYDLDVSLSKVKLPPANDVAECLDCGRSIGSARKRAMPSATRCIECQSAAENKGR